MLDNRPANFYQQGRVRRSSRNYPVMKKSFLVLTVVLAAAFSPLRVHGAAGYLYESDFGSGSIFQFTTSASGTVVKLTFATGLTGVRGLAFDRAGNLFVGQEDKIIRITPSGFMSDFALGVHGPNYLAFDPAGDLYASDRDGNVVRFKPYGTRSFFVTGLDKPTGLAFDTNGNLFVADSAKNALYKITPSGLKSTFAAGLSGPDGVTFDRFGILHVTNAGTGTIEAFTPVGSRFTKVFGLNSPVGLAFDSVPPIPSPTPSTSPTPNNLFVADKGTNSIVKFASGAATGATYASSLNVPLQLAFEPARDPLLNISTRARVETGQNRELIGGFIIPPGAAKTVLIRAIGPTLAKSNVTGSLPDPILELHSPDGSITSNDNWMDSQKTEIQNTGLAPKDDRESAILASLAPGNYTAIIRGKPPIEDGVALVEVYDLDPAASSTLANLSTRGFVQSADNVLIGGFIIGGGNGAGKVMIRALGPSLSDAGITRVLPDPVVTLYNSSGTLLAANDDWADTQPLEIEATGIAPPSTLESAIVTTLRSGSYTAIVQDLKGNSGVALVEVYNLR